MVLLCNPSNYVIFVDPCARAGAQSSLCWGRMCQPEFCDWKAEYSAHRHAERNPLTLLPGLLHSLERV